MKQTAVSQYFTQREIRLMKDSCELRDQTTLKEAGIIDCQVTLKMRKKYFPPWNILVNAAMDGNKSFNLQINQENPEVHYQ